MTAAEEFLGRLLWETETHYPGTTVLRCGNTPSTNQFVRFFILIYTSPTSPRCKGLLAVKGEDVQVILELQKVQ